MGHYKLCKKEITTDNSNISILCNECNINLHTIENPMFITEFIEFTCDRAQLIEYVFRQCSLLNKTIEECSLEEVLYILSDYIDIMLLFFYLPYRKTNVGVYDFNFDENGCVQIKFYAESKKDAQEFVDEYNKFQNTNETFETLFTELKEDKQNKEKE